MNEALKPDLVDYGGNQLVDPWTGSMKVGSDQFGEVSTSHALAEGRPFGRCNGTSFAAPRVSNLAASVLRHIPRASADLCRALLVAHARVPAACADMSLGPDTDVRHIVGYGLVDRHGLFRSLDDCVTLWAVDRIENKQHHFFEIPIPPEYWSPERRLREMTVALAYRPPVRTTRVDYRATRISYMLVQSEFAEQVVQSFNAASDPEVTPPLPERNSARSLSATARSRGTVQASTWQFKQPSEKMRQRWVVVVTRNDPAWGGRLSSEREEYALAVVLADRKRGQARLYHQIRAELRTRLRARATRLA